MLANIWLWHETLGNQAEPIELPGVCDICECQDGTLQKLARLQREIASSFAFRGGRKPDADAT